MRKRVTSLPVKTPYMVQGTGKPTPPVARSAAAKLPTLSAQERLQERLEARRMAQGWRESKPPARGHGGA
jgi:hypothetical protein